jgi:hypothetical protein
MSSPGSEFQRIAPLESLFSAAFAPERQVSLFEWVVDAVGYGN